MNDAGCRACAPQLHQERRRRGRDRAAADFSKLAAEDADGTVTFDDLMGIFDKAILRVENTELDLTFEGNIADAIEEAVRGLDPELGETCTTAVKATADIPLEVLAVIGTGYGRQTLPFAREDIRSEILCHGLGAHHQFAGTRTVLDIGGQDTNAIQVDDNGIVTSFQMRVMTHAQVHGVPSYAAADEKLPIGLPVASDRSGSST